jgi:hypothetical protein
MLGDQMQTQNKIIIALLAVAMLGISLPSVAAQSYHLEYEHSAGIVSLSTDNLEIKVVGANEQPHFHWWSPTDPDLDYHMRFLSIYEVDDINDNGVYDHGVDPHISPMFMLPTTDWEFSGFETESEDGNITAVHFNFTSLTGFDPRPEGVEGNWTTYSDIDDMNVFVQILVHIDMDTPNEIKFDLVIDGWTWTRDDSLLVFQFVITESNHGDGEPENAPRYFHRTETKFEFSNGYVEYEPTALAARNTLSVGASYGETSGLLAGEAVYLAFPYFGNETLFYDPIIGINSDSSGLTDPLIDTPTLYIAGGVIGLVALVAIILKVRK